jgi:hypothetical protein
MVDVLGMVAEGTDVLAAQQAAGSKPGLVRDRDDDRPGAHPTKLGQRRLGPVEMLEHLEAEDEVEAAVVERQLVDALARDLDLRQPRGGELDRLRAQVDGRDSRREQIAEALDRLALPAAGIE